MGNTEQTLSFVEQWGSKTPSKNMAGLRTDYLLLSASNRIRITALSLVAPINSPIVLKVKIFEVDTQKFIHQKTFNINPIGSKQLYFYYNFKKMPVLKRSGTLLLMCEITGGPTYTFKKSKNTLLAEDNLRINISRDLPKQVQRLIAPPEGSVQAHIFQGIKFVRDDQETSWYYCS